MEHGKSEVWPVDFCSLGAMRTNSRVACVSSAERNFGSGGTSLPGAANRMSAMTKKCQTEVGTPAPRLCALALLLLLALAPPPSGAAIFMRLGSGATALEQLGGMPLQRADVRINGQPGQMSVYGFDTAPELLAQDLRKALHLPELTVAGAALATHVENGQATSLLLLPGASPQRSIAILIEQSADAHEKSRAAPAAWPAGIACPNADLLFSAENEKTHTALAVAASRDTPQDAVRDMDGVLADAGWARIPPFAAAAGLTLYSRGNRVCAVSATGDRPGHTRITVLQRLGTSP